MFDRKAYMREWKRNHAAEVRTYDNRYYREHRDAGCRQSRKWRLANHEHAIWLKMLRRCSNPRAADYFRYGERGIRVLYKNFYDFLSDVGCWPGEGYSVDRINNDGNYEPGNVRWATRKEQAANRRPKARLGV